MDKNVQSSVLLQFPAGKMILKDGMVTPDTRKGILKIVREPNSLSIIWSSGTHGEGHKLPRGVKFGMVEKCTTGRVISFDLGKGKDPLFYWLQEKSTDNDDGYLSEIDRLIRESGIMFDNAMEGLDKILQNIIRGNSEKREADISLVDIIGSTKFLEVLREDSAFFMCALHHHLPEGTDPTADILEQVRNPQVYSAAAALTEALRNPVGFRQLCTGFNINATKPTVRSFLKGVMKLQKNDLDPKK